MYIYVRSIIYLWATVFSTHVNLQRTMMGVNNIIDVTLHNL